MGEKPLPSSAPSELPLQDAPTGGLSASIHAGPVRLNGNYPSVFSPPHSRQQQSQTADSQNAFASQLEMAYQQRTGPFDLRGMANALPQQSHPTQPYGQGQQRYNTTTASSPATAAQVPVPRFGAPTTPMGPVPGQQYYVPQHALMAPYYATPMPPRLPAAMPSRADLSYYQNHMFVGQPPHPGPHYYYAPASVCPGQLPHPQGQPIIGPFEPPSVQQHPGTRLRNLQSDNQEANSMSPERQGEVPTNSRQSIVRGPPRKPRQSGHAIWIGNLPPQTDLMSLVHHVCKEADGLESLFLISKSNCAFANFKNEQSCAAAQRKLHDSKFMTVRLVSRLRKSTVEGPAGVTAPTGPATSAPQAGATQEAKASGGVETGGGEVAAPTPVQKNHPEAKAAIRSAEAGSSQKERFFILKSLTVEDLELSVRTNIWATQSHNEETLNEAFKTSDNVYLVFSANKSGEYFGYARMMSPINDDPAAAIEFAPSAHLASDVDLPKAIPTEATEFAPKGRIIDDSARGTIFWEADRDDRAPDGAAQDSSSSGNSASGDTGSVRSGQEDAGGEPKAWGKPFRLEWLSTTRLPFYRTRGLRNPWNSNREVKIARDGTELEPSVGRRLIGLFNTVQSPALGNLPGQIPQVAVAGAGVPLTVSPGYVMRPHY
ncbi:hypothetical protein VTK56DRAFT_8691 [Thermocarpiscus australiensis]